MAQPVQGARSPNGEHSTVGARSAAEPRLDHEAGFHDVGAKARGALEHLAQIDFREASVLLPRHVAAPH